MKRQYVAIDLHRRRSLIVRDNQVGEELGVVRIENDSVALRAALAEAGPEPEVAIEATYGWYWAVDRPSPVSFESKKPSLHQTQGGSSGTFTATYPPWRCRYWNRRH